MQAFRTHRGRVAPVNRANIDTDQIIPKQFLKSIRRTGFGEALFFDWARRADGTPDPDFTLNQPRYRGATVLLARNNFGCGSSREHAVWAVMQAGFRVVIAPSIERGGQRLKGFADIFANNAVKNGLLTVELPEAVVDELFDFAERFPALELTVDLDEQRIVVHMGEEANYHFDVDPAVKGHLVRGLDDVGLTLQHEPAITRFEQRHNAQMPR